VSSIAPEDAPRPRAKTLGKLLPRSVTDKRELATLYRKAREDAGLSQRELATRLGVQPKFVACCELEDWPQTFSTQHLMRGDTKWSVPIMVGIAGHHRAQVLDAPDAVTETHLALCAQVTSECNAATSEYTAALATLTALDGDPSPAALDSLQRRSRAGANALLRADRKATVALMRQRGGK
jgi:hypothetical protein